MPLLGSAQGADVATKFVGPTLVVDQVEKGKKLRKVSGQGPCRDIDAKDLNLNSAWLDLYIESSYLEAKLRLPCAAEITYSRALVNHHNHFGHDGSRDPEITHVFDGSVSLFLNGSSEERIEVISTESYNTLREIITDTKFFVPHEDVLVKQHFLFRDSSLAKTLSSIVGSNIGITLRETVNLICQRWTIKSPSCTCNILSYLISCAITSQIGRIVSK
ncbi:uncharacterized protein A4U43_C01F14110 [Asparagus officinalis]|uniref:Uncharacterized protein n=1 Tax=Asparagus officinalis TaxID=4686 RepID=A0A5P1FPT4_ASPOF|nr:uncharacterized protein A4U43_C01F14110 [Asparagus officinalis]